MTSTMVIVGVSFVPFTFSVIVCSAVAVALSVTRIV